KHAMIGSPLLGHEEPVRAVAFSSNDDNLMSIGLEGTLVIWHLGHGKPAFQGHKGEALAVAFTADSSNLQSFGEDGELIKWNPQTSSMVGRKLIHQTSKAAFSRNGMRLATLIRSGCSYGYVRIYDNHRCKKLQEPN